MPSTFMCRRQHPVADGGYRSLARSATEYDCAASICCNILYIVACSLVTAVSWHKDVWQTVRSVSHGTLLDHGVLSCRLVSKMSAAVVATTGAVVAHPLAAEAAVTPSLKNLLQSVLAGGTVLFLIFGAVSVVAQFDTVARK